MKRTKRRRPLRLLAVILLALVLGALWFRWQNWALETNEHTVPPAGLPAGFDGLRIAHLSDLHGHEYGEGSAELLSAVAAAEPELILVTGDLIDQEAQMDMVPALAKGLAEIAPTYYVTGNHEWALGTAAVKQLKALLTDCGVNVLSNRYEVLERGGDTLLLAGVDDPNGYADQKTPEALYTEMEGAHPGAFSLLLAHRNDQFDRYAAAGFDLVFSGHGHGGIVRLPFTDGLLGTNRNFFPTRTAGVYTQGDSTLFVSRGLGNNTVPIRGFRLFNRPDLAVVELRAEQSM
ncbi:MAG: metallophosphoesterase [Oscillospiraceae bacterium]|nr:metallophosphoesterase [Oscillospiraceae bacterium]